MSPSFNAEEVLEIAVQIEKTGAEFYREAARLAGDDESSELLLELAAMEDAHEITFETMRADPDSLAVLIGDPEGEAALYLRAFARGHVFHPGDEPRRLLTAGVSVEAILRQAIKLELTSIAFYLGIRDAMAQELGREKVDDIIAEERRHVTALSERIAALA